MPDVGGGLTMCSGYNIVCNSILIHVQLRFWMPSAAWSIFFLLSCAQRDNNTVFENEVHFAVIYIVDTDMRPVFLILAVLCEADLVVLVGSVITGY